MKLIDRFCESFACAGLLVLILGVTGAKNLPSGDTAHPPDEHRMRDVRMRERVSSGEVRYSDSLARKGVLREAKGRTMGESSRR